MAFQSSKFSSLKSEEDEVVISSFEKLLDGIVHDGRFQWRLLFLFLVPVSFFYMAAATNYILLMTTPTHHCYVPGRLHTNLTEEQWNNLTIPWEIGSEGEIRQSRCQMYNISYNHNDDYFTDYSNSTIDCNYGWYYESSSWIDGPVQKFDLVCEKRYLVALFFTLQLVGKAVGTLSLSLISDRFGRKPVFYIALLLNLIFGNAIICIPSFFWFVIFRVLSSLAFFSIYQIPYIITIELCGVHLRKITTLVTFLTFTLGHGFLVLVGWQLQNWRVFLLVTQLPLGIFILYWRIIPESPRWLLSQGKLEECKKVMNKIASVNGVEFTEEMGILLKKAREEEMKKIPATKILTSYVLMKHLILISFVLSASLLSAVSLNINVHILKGSVFLNYLILRLFEVPGDLFATVASSYLGRRFNGILCMLLASTFITIASFKVAETWLLTILCGITKLFIRANITSSYVQTGELFPTALRSTAYGITGIASLSATVLAPSIVALGYVNVHLPYYILCGICASCAVVTTLLPETMGNPLPQTMKEAKQIGKCHSYFSLRTKGDSYVSSPAKKIRPIFNLEKSVEPLQTEESKLTSW